MLSHNRTSVELKHERARVAKTQADARHNRTSVELKPISGFSAIYTILSHNRTSVELKLSWCFNLSLFR